jgi:hypothetical protein
VPGDKTSFEYRNIAGKIDELKDMVVWMCIMCGS